MNYGFLMLACATCRPDPGSPVASAASGAILIMLVVMGLVFAGLGTMIIGMVRRARNPIPPSPPDPPSTP